jgi:hypothetical protein
VTQTITIIQFEIANGSYQAGERAGFPADVAKAYIDRGIAKLVKTGAPICEPGLETLAQ